MGTARPDHQILLSCCSCCSILENCKSNGISAVLVADCSARSVACGCWRNRYCFAADISACVRLQAVRSIIVFNTFKRIQCTQAECYLFVHLCPTSLLLLPLGLLLFLRAIMQGYYLYLYIHIILLLQATKEKRLTVLFSLWYDCGRRFAIADDIVAPFADYSRAASSYTWVNTGWVVARQLCPAFF